MRSDLELILADSPSLRRRAREFVAEEMKRTGRLVVRLLRQHGEDPSGVQARVDAGGYTEEQVLGDWWPEPPPPPLAG